jgi:hypothetical protein
MGGANISKDNRIRPPAQKSLLATLWPVVGDDFRKADSETGYDRSDSDMDNGESEPISVPFIRRFPSDAAVPLPPEDIARRRNLNLQEEKKQFDGRPLFDWAGEVVRRSGTVIHQWLKMICEDGIERWTAERITAQTGSIRQDLIRSGVSREKLNDAVASVISALVNTVTHDRGRWILTRHPQSACEYALTGQVDGGIVNVVLDRTFVDQGGTRWVIDYKSGVHTGGSMDDFMDQEKVRYRSQMELYAQLMAMQHPGPARIGLYFPRLKGWREWEYVPFS